MLRLQEEFEERVLRDEQQGVLRTRRIQEGPAREVLGTGRSRWAKQPHAEEDDATDADVILTASEDIEYASTLSLLFSYLHYGQAWPNLIPYAEHGWNFVRSLDYTLHLFALCHPKYIYLASPVVYNVYIKIKKA